MSKETKYGKTVGFWILIIVGILLLIMLILGQTMSFISYDFSVSIGLQEPKEEITELGIAVNKGIGVGDTIIYIPILLFGLIGLWLRKIWGVFMMAGAMAITAYWPMVSIFILLYAIRTPGFNFANFTSYAIVLTMFTLYGLWGLWFLYKNQKMLANE